MGITEDAWTLNESGIFMKKNQATLYSLTSIEMKARLANDFFYINEIEMFYHYEKDYFNKYI